MAKRDPRTHEADFWGMARSFLHGWCPKVRGLSANTVESYRISLESYLAYLEEEHGKTGAHVTFGLFERAFLKGWVEWMTQKRRYKPKTVALRLTAMRSFLGFCAGEDVGLAALHRAVKTIKAPAEPRRPIEYLKEDELAAVLNAYDGTTAKRRRNRMMLVMLYESAARVSELTSMTVGDLCLERPARITIVGKGSKARVVPLGDKCADHLRIYLDEFHPGPDSGKAVRPLFYSIHSGSPCMLSADAVSRVLKQAADIARVACPSIPERIHCHMMRKTRAMTLYGAGVPLPLVMQMLGHESMATTSTFYAFATLDMMTKAIADAAPECAPKQPSWLTAERKAALYSLK